jgi:hypothetical protein
VQSPKVIVAPYTATVALSRPSQSTTAHNPYLSIISAKCYRAHSAFDDIGIDFDATIVEKA